MREIDGVTDLNVVTCNQNKKRELFYVREISLTSTSSKDHLLNNLTVPSPTISGGRMEIWVTGSSPARQSQTHIQNEREKEMTYRRT